MKKIVAGLCCASMLLAFSSEGFSATKKRKRVHHRAPRGAVTKSAPTPIQNSTPVAPAAEAPKPGWTDKFEATWKKGLQFKTKDEKYSMKFRVRVQPQFQYQSRNADGKSKEDTFRIRRAKLSWEGNVFTKNLDYKLQLSVATSNFSDMLEDAYLDYRVVDPFRVQFGQFKIPYNRQQINSSGRLQLVDRSLASDEFRFSSIDRTNTTTCTLPGGATITGSGVTCTGAGVTSTTNTTDALRRFHFDTGLMLHGDFADKKVEYAVAITNGTGPNRLNLNKGLLYTGRVVWNALGKYGYSESDVENSEHPALMFGASSGFNTQDITNNKIFQAGAEAGFKYKGFSLQGEYFFRHNKIKELNGKPASLSTDDHGYYAQAGYFILPTHLEVAARASQVFLDGPNNNKSEYTGGLNYYFFGHDLKLQADYSYLRSQVDPTKFAGARNQNDHRVRLQLQAWF
ncbi:MAG: hypothetical protein JNK65_04805 [Deltaproteobacteria bacterium]|nr:hypothetical protein [Deltaproteobacteria bacterium]